MVKHVLLMAVLDEMERLAQKLKALTDVQPDGWRELYTSYRRQLGLCVTEIVKLAQSDLVMSKADSSGLEAEMDECIASLAAHQSQYPIEGLVLDDPAYLMSFAQLHEAFHGFKAMMIDLIDTYLVEPEGAS